MFIGMIENWWGEGGRGVGCENDFVYCLFNINLNYIFIFEGIVFF